MGKGIMKEVKNEVNRRRREEKTEVQREVQEGGLNGGKKKTIWSEAGKMLSAPHKSSFAWQSYNFLFHMLNIMVSRYFPPRAISPVVHTGDQALNIKALNNTYLNLSTYLSPLV